MRWFIPNRTSTAESIFFSVTAENEIGVYTLRILRGWPEFQKQSVTIYIPLLFALSIMSPVVNKIKHSREVKKLAQ